MFVPERLHSTEPAKYPVSWLTLQDPTEPSKSIGGWIDVIDCLAVHAGELSTGYGAMLSEFASIMSLRQLSRVSLLYVVTMFTDWFSKIAPLLL